MSRHLYITAVNIYLKQALEHFSTIEAVCERENLTCEIVLIPYEYQLRIADQDDAFLPQERLKAHLSGSDLSVYDPAAFLLENSRGSESLYLYADGIHLSRKGHGLIAEYLRDRPSFSEVPQH